MSAFAEKSPPSPPGAAGRSTRRYAIGVALVALLGVAMLAGYVLWSSHALERALDQSRDERARHAGAAYRDKLTRALGTRDPTSPEVWAALDPTLEEAFDGLPNLRGIVIHIADGTIGAVIGPSELRRLPFLPAPAGAGAMDVRVDSETTERAVVTVAFAVPPDRTPAVQANVQLDLLALGALGPSIGVLFRFGTVLVSLLIYVLAVLAVLIARQGTRAANREREKAVRLAAIGDVAGAIAHELRNPLNAISLSFQVLGENIKKTGEDENRVADLARARGEVTKISKVVDNFVSFARLADMTMSEFDVADVAREAIGRLAERCAEASVRPSVTVEGATTIRGDRDKIGQALATTLQAALDAVETRPGTLDVEVRGGSHDVGVKILCRGARIDSRRISNFTSSRRSWDEPVGLALTIARTWIDLHGGTVTGSEPARDKVALEILLPKRLA